MNTAAPHRFPGPLWYTAISGNIVGKNVHATIPKGNRGYDQYTVPDFEAVEPTFAAFESNDEGRLYSQATYLQLSPFTPCQIGSSEVSVKFSLKKYERTIQCLF